MARALIASLLVAAALLAGGCGSSETGAVRFLVFGDPEELRAYRQVVLGYEERSGRVIPVVILRPAGETAVLP